MGSIVEENGKKIVGEDFTLATAADIVADPSAPDAFVQGIMEQREWIWKSKVSQEVLEGYKKTVEKTPTRNLQKTFIKLFDDFMGRI